MYKSFRKKWRDGGASLERHSTSRCRSQRVNECQWIEGREYFYYSITEFELQISILVLISNVEMMPKPFLWKGATAQTVQLPTCQHLSSWESWHRETRIRYLGVPTNGLIWPKVDFATKFGQKYGARSLNYIIHKWDSEFALVCNLLKLTLHILCCKVQFGTIHT